MPTNYRIVGLWVLFTAMVAILSSDQRVAAVPAPDCQKCTCQTAPVWRVNSSPTYFGLREGTTDTTIVDTMFTEIRVAYITVESNWADQCKNTAVIDGPQYPVYSYSPGPATVCGNGPTSGYKFVACGAQNSGYTKLTSSKNGPPNTEPKKTCQ
jgi:hypothetical protein